MESVSPTVEQIVKKVDNPDLAKKIQGCADKQEFYAVRISVSQSEREDLDEAVFRAANQNMRDQLSKGKGKKGKKGN